MSNFINNRGHLFSSNLLIMLKKVINFKYKHILVHNILEKNIKATIKKRSVKTKLQDKDIVKMLRLNIDFK